MDLSFFITNSLLNRINEANRIDDEMYYQKADALIRQLSDLKVSDLQKIGKDSYIPTESANVVPKDITFVFHTSPSSDDDGIYYIINTSENPLHFEIHLFDIDINSIGSSIVKPLLLHELIHYYDFKRRKGEQFKGYKGESDSDYFNDPNETNAFYQMFAGEVISAFKKLKPERLIKTYPTFQSFFDMVKQHRNFESTYNQFSEENKRKVQKRLYNFYDDYIVKGNKD